MSRRTNFVQTDTADEQSCALAHAALPAGRRVRPSSVQAGPVIISVSIHFQMTGTIMNDSRLKEIQRAQRLIGEAKGILELAAAQEQDDLDKMPQDLQNSDAGERAEDAVDALERAAVSCDDAISACEEAIQR
jgi:hypothetical protein